MTGAWPWQGVLRALVHARASELQLAQYVAVLKGIRKALDDWIPLQRLDICRRLFADLGLAVEIDCIFAPLARPDHVLGAQVVPTTEAIALPYRASTHAPEGSSVHIVVSSRPDYAAEALASGFYHSFIAGRILRKPLVDHHWLGEAFGYPSCCVRFFLEHNDWPRQNTYAETTQASRRLCWETNCLPKHTPFMALFHIPCAWDCEATRSYTRDVLQAVAMHDEAYAQAIERLMRTPALTLSEVSTWAMHGGRHDHGGRVRYASAQYLGSDLRRDRGSVILARGDALAIDAGSVLVFREGRLTDVLPAKCDAGVIEVPLMLMFQ